MMEMEIEKLYAEAIPNKRGKMSMKHLDLTFRKIGITLAVQQIRSLFFRYDKTKTKQLDLEEFRQLIEDITKNPSQSLSQIHPLCCDDAESEVGTPDGYRIKSRYSDIIEVHTKHGGGQDETGICDGRNSLKPGSLWSADDCVQVVCSDDAG